MEGIIIRLHCSDISIVGRIASGVKLMNVQDDVVIASVEKMRKSEENNSGEDGSEENISDDHS